KMLASEARQRKSPDAKNGTTSPGAMSASCLTEQKCAAQNGMSALPPKADMCGANRNVRFGPKADSCAAAILSFDQRVDEPRQPSRAVILIFDRDRSAADRRA